jgi:hypothetical protein
MTRRKRERELLVALAGELVRNLTRNQYRLPVKVVEARAFGSVLREREDPHDLDVVFLYEMDANQQTEWDWFASIFGTVNFIKDPDLRQKVDRARDLL